MFWLTSNSEWNFRFAAASVGCFARRSNHEKDAYNCIGWLALTLCANFVQAQRGSDNCEVYVVDADLKQDVMLEKFDTFIGEEELTNKNYPLLKTGFVITASVYYTDESMASEHGYDSMMLGVTVSEKALPDAFSTPNNAFAEVTLATLDMIRAKMYYTVKGKTYLIGIQCSKGKHEDIN